MIFLKAKLKSFIVLEHCKMNIFRLLLLHIFWITYRFIMSIPIHIIRKAFFRKIVKSCGKNVYIGQNIDVIRPSQIVIGDNVFINKRVLLDGRNHLVIGNNVDIAREVNIWTRHHDYNDDYHLVKGGETIVGDYVWLCSRCTILPHVRIGRGAVVACGAVVTKDVPEMDVVGGVPAKRIAARKSRLLYTLQYKFNYIDL